MREEKGGFKKGSKHTKESIEKISESLKGKTGMSARRWRGERAGYVAFHSWLKKYYGKPNKCENLSCTFKKPKRYEYALREGCKHNHKRENYIMLCTSCHRKYDMTPELKERLTKQLLTVRHVK